MRATLWSHRWHGRPVDLPPANALRVGASTSEREHHDRRIGNARDTNRTCVAAKGLSAALHLLHSPACHGTVVAAILSRARALWISSQHGVRYRRRLRNLRALPRLPRCPLSPDRSDARIPALHAAARAAVALRGPSDRARRPQR